MLSNNIIYSKIEYYKSITFSYHLGHKSDGIKYSTLTPKIHSSIY